MLNIYKYYSSTFQSNCQITYEDGFFKSLELDQPVPYEDLSRTTIYKCEAAFLEASKTAKCQLTKIDRLITFEMFYEKYGYKVGKPEALKAWNKLSKSEQQEAFDYLATYLNHKKLTNLALAYPSRYLNSKTFVK